MNPGVQPSDIHQLVDHLFRHKAGQMISTLTRIFGFDHLELAEDVVQETLIKAMQLWPYRGVPDNPGAWIVQVAKNRALDILRREAVFRDKAAQWLDQEELQGDVEAQLSLDDPLGDDQLTMMFIGCHPALSPEARVALTLKTVGGFGVSEIAHAFLVKESAIAQRLVRAKRMIRDEHLPFRLPDAHELPARLDSVLEVLYLLFNEGYNAHTGADLIRLDLCGEAIRLCRLLSAHALGDRPPVHALLALMLLQASRLPARVDEAGDMLLLAEQDRGRWDRQTMAQGFFHLDQARSGDELSQYHLQAGIAACHAAAQTYESTDWATIRFYYDQLLALNASPIIALNRAVAVSMVDGVQAAIAALEQIKDHPQLKSYYLLPATFGDLYERMGQTAQAVIHYRSALKLAANESERRFLLRKLQRAEVAAQTSAR
jgi:RNA polymerase sigma-70 factor (ECF subfamily)